MKKIQHIIQLTFFPSAETTYTYTLTGTIDNTPVHISYSCVPGGGEDDDDESSGGDNTKTVTFTRRH